MEKEQLESIEQKIDELSQNIRLISERQNSQYTDIMLLLKEKIDEDLIDNRSIEELYEEVKEDIIALGRVSTSYIQRIERIGYAKAAKIMDMLEERNVVSKGDGSKPREVLIKPEEE